jgi:putative tryptophan/tyrosine transport system substrate-binding protein
MMRREFITLLGSTLAAWATDARAQQAAMPVIGWLNAGSGNDPIFAKYVPSFRSGLGEVGYAEGQNVAIELHWADGQYDRLPALAAELVRKRVTVIAAGAPPAAAAAKAATATIPIVFTVGSNPVKLGLVASLNHPGGNATGINLIIDEVEPKRLGLLHEVLPAATKIAALFNAKRPDFRSFASDLMSAARANGLDILTLPVADAKEIDRLGATLSQAHVGALLISSDPFLISARTQLVALASRLSLPTMFDQREAAESGGLMSYGISIPDGYRQAGVYVGRILKGDVPADLPVIQATKFDFVVNMKTAKSLGLTIPPGVLAIADEVIE